MRTVKASAIHMQKAIVIKKLLFLDRHEGGAQFFKSGDVTTWYMDCYWLKIGRDQPGNEV
jgi:hypothetical protein